MIEKKLDEIYKKAKYIALLEDGLCRLRVGFPSSEINALLDRYETQTAYFITPENPFSQILGQTENRLRHQRFVSALLEKNLGYIEGYGTDEDETWAKDGITLNLIPYLEANPIVKKSHYCLPYQLLNSTICKQVTIF